MSELEKIKVDGVWYVQSFQHVLKDDKGRYWIFDQRLTEKTIDQFALLQKEWRELRDIAIRCHELMDEWEDVHPLSSRFIDLQNDINRILKE